MNCFVIVNPDSGRGNGKETWGIVKKVFETEKIPYEVFLTEKAGDATAKVSEITRDLNTELTIFVIGGDGTFNEVVNGMNMNAPVRLALVPSGSANDLAKALKINPDTEKLVYKQLTAPEVKDIDYGVVTADHGAVNHRFLVSCGVGFDAAVCDSLNHSTLKTVFNRLGIAKLAYTLIGFSEYVKAVPTKIKLELDSEKTVEFKSIFFISIHNFPYEGGGYQFAPAAEGNDGILNVTAVNSANKPKILPVILSGKSGLKESGMIRFFTCKEAQLSIENPLTLHADGEILGKQTEVAVRCVHGQLKIIV